MLEPGQRVRITYYHGDNNNQTEEWNLIVREYDNGLVKVAVQGGREQIFNLRSLAVVRVDIE